MADAPGLSAVFGLEPREAVEFFRQKGFRIEFDYRDVWQEEHQGAFTVAKAMSIDLLRDIRAAVDDALANGTTFETFQAELTPRLIKRGWWGQKEMTDPLTGERKRVQLGSPRRLELIYDTNLRQAHAEGQWERIQDAKDILPYLMYDHLPSAHERKEHAAWDGLVLPVDDPWWQAHYPVKAYNCKCGVIQLSDRQLERLGAKVGTAPEERYVEYVNKRTGETQRVPVGVDPSFHYPPGGRRANLDKMLSGKIDALPPDLAAVARRTLDRPALPPVVSGYVGPVDKDFKKSMREGLASIPEAVRETVRRAGFLVMGGRTLPEISPDLKTRPPPRGYPSGTTWENIDGVTHLDKKYIAIASTLKLRDGTIEAASAARVGALLRHEHGHALDGVIQASASVAFMEAYAQDAEKLAAWLDKNLHPDVEDEIRYLLQKGRAGREEVFAELFAERYGGGTASCINVADAMPRCREVVRAIMEGLDEKGVR